MEMNTTDNEPVEDALEDFGDGLNCAQSVLAAFSEQYGLPRDAARKVAAAFGGGMASSGGPCGAVTGALMAVGLARGASAAHDGEAKAATTTLAKDFCRCFAEQHGSITCRDLLGVDIGTPRGRAQAVAQGLFRTQCPKYVGDAARILCRLLPR